MSHFIQAYEGLSDHLSDLRYFYKLKLFLITVLYLVISIGNLFFDSQPGI